MAIQASLEVAQLVSTIQIATIIAVVSLIGIGAISTAFGFTVLGSKFLESVARQPELIQELQVKLFIIAGLLDAISMIGVGVALFFTFANPFMAALVEYLPKAL